MRIHIKLVLLILISYPSLGQVDTITVNNKKVEVFNYIPNTFEFNTFDTTLTTTGFEQLKKFGKFYRDSLLMQKKYIISLGSGLAVEEKNVNEQLGYKRIMIIVNYLEMNFQISKTEFLDSYSETITTNAGIGFLIRAREGHKKKKWKLKKID